MSAFFVGETWDALMPTPLQLFGSPLGFAVLAAGLLIAAWRAAG